MPKTFLAMVRYKMSGNLQISRKLSENISNQIPEKYFSKFSTDFRQLIRGRRLFHFFFPVCGVYWRAALIRGWILKSLKEGLKSNTTEAFYQIKSTKIRIFKFATFQVIPGNLHK